MNIGEKQNAIVKKMPYDCKVEWIGSTPNGGQVIDLDFNYDGQFSISGCLCVSEYVPGSMSAFGACEVDVEWATMRTGRSTRIEWLEGGYMKGGVPSNSITFDYNVGEFYDFFLKSRHQEFGLNRGSIQFSNDKCNQSKFGLFCRWNNIGWFTGGAFRFKSFKAVDKYGVTVRDCIPVKSEGQGYMYDKVSRRMFGNIGTGIIEIGPEVKRRF